MKSGKRTAAMPKHRAKRVERFSTKEAHLMKDERIKCEQQTRLEIEEEQKRAYADFICRLLARMDLESLMRMLDAAIDEIR
jgi:pyruvate-formate lyase